MKKCTLLILLLLRLIGGLITNEFSANAQNVTGFNQIYQIPDPIPGSDVILSKFDPKQVMVMNSGNYHYVIGTFQTSSVASNIFVMKTDRSGNIVWSKQYGNTTSGASESASTLEVSHDNNSIVVVGKLISADPMVSSGVLIFKILKSNGTIVWSKKYVNLGLDGELNTIVKRSTIGNNYYVLSGLKAHQINNNSLLKPIAMAINDSDGSLRWANLYVEGQAEYTDNFDHIITGFAIRDSELALVGKYYNAFVNEPALISLFKISPFTGNLIVNNMKTYDLENNVNDWAIETDVPFVWEIARVFHPTTGAFIGHAIAGTYITAPNNDNSSEVAVLRLDADMNALWANMYDMSNSSKGFGRGIYQNQTSGHMRRLDVFTTHDQTNTGSNRISGLLSVNIFNGNIMGFQSHTLNDIYAGFLGASLNRIEDNSGYIGLAEDITIGDDAFQLIAMDDTGNSGGCQEIATIEAVPLTTRRSIIELVKEPLQLEVSDYPLPMNELAINSTLCADYIALASLERSRQSLIESDVVAGKDSLYIQVNPNPLPASATEWQLQFSTEKSEQIQVIVYDLFHRIILERKFNLLKGVEQLSIPAQEIPKGIYILKVQQDGKYIYTTKLIRE